MPKNLFEFKFEISSLTHPVTITISETQCVVVAGGKCTCPAGYDLEADGKTCSKGKFLLRAKPLAPIILSLSLSSVQKEE